jgi:Tfp pilus assembly pilus retraction ATPase PilT
MATETKKKKVKVAVKKMTPLQQKWQQFLAVDSNYQALLAKGRQVIRDAKGVAGDDGGASSGAAFHATLSKLTMTNFMGIQGTVEIPLAGMKNGIWLIEGDNGSGKSTIFEAIGMNPFVSFFFFLKFSDNFFK